jgi:ABC-type cobalamin/Fe3+-siderophores transport system ATPase subunit
MAGYNALHNFVVWLLVAVIFYLLMELRAVHIENVLASSTARMSGVMELREQAIQPQVGAGRAGAVGTKRRGQIHPDAHHRHHHPAEQRRGLLEWRDIAAKPDSLRRVLGYLPQDFGVYPNLNAVEFLTYLAAVKGLNQQQARRRIDELIQLVNLTEAAYRPIGSFSGGMRQRVGIAQALLNDPIC